MARTIPMEYKEIQEARNLGIPEYIIAKLANGVEPSEQDKDVINRHGKEYVSVHAREGKRVKPHLRDFNGGVAVGKTTVDRYVEGIIVGKALEVPNIYANEVIQRLRDRGYKIEITRRMGYTHVMLLDSGRDSGIPKGFREVSKDVTVEKMYSRAVGDYNFDIPTGQEPYDDYLGDRIGAVGEDVGDTIEILKDNGYSDEVIQDILDDLDIYGEVEFKKPIKVEAEYLVRD